MTRIMIDISDSGATVSQPGSGQATAPSAAVTSPGASADLLARASALGANNGGPAPTAGTSLPESVPAPVASRGIPEQRAIGSVSAGPVPESAFGSNQS